MNLVFLDVDYVLTSLNAIKADYERTGERNSASKVVFDENCLEALKMIIDETDAKIVISSSWRKYEVNKNVLLAKLAEYNLADKVIGYTPDLGVDAKRETEIKAFLDEYGWENYFVILDDLEMNELLPYQVQTNLETGLTEDDAEFAIWNLKSQSTMRERFK